MAAMISSFDMIFLQIKKPPDWAAADNWFLIGDC
jgi:hypothetical protein